MHYILDIFIDNLTLIIAFLYIKHKLKERYLKNKNASYLNLITPLSLSLLSVWVMHHPIFFENMRIDLRGVPLFFVAYLCGFRMGFLAILLPTWFRFEMGGPTFFEGISQSIILPFIIGSLFHDRSGFNPPFTLINLIRFLTGFLVFELIKSIMMFFTTPADICIILLMVLFELIAIFSIALINNDTNRGLLTRKELEFHSRRDGMTNLYNLRYFNSKAAELIAKNKLFVIGMVDVDYFKNYNDIHGHQAGDTVLKTIGQLLAASMKDGDIFARYGGEEFIIGVNVDKGTATHHVIERFRHLVETYPFYGEESQPNKKITVSIGLSEVSEGKTIEELIGEADEALYLSKRSGRNTVRTYSR